MPPPKVLSNAPGVVGKSLEVVARHGGPAGAVQRKASPSVPVAPAEESGVVEGAAGRVEPYDEGVGQG